MSKDLEAETAYCIYGKVEDLAQLTLLSKILAYLQQDLIRELRSNQTVLETKWGC